MAEVVAERYGGSGRPDARPGPRARARARRAADRMSVAAIVLAAGRVDGFGGGKLLAPSSRAGRSSSTSSTRSRRPGSSEVVVVLGRRRREHRGGDRVARRSDASRNPEPGRGLSSSLQVGIEARRRRSRRRRPPSSCSATSRACRPARSGRSSPPPADPDRPIVAPRYADDGGRNPVLLGRDGVRPRRPRRAATAGWGR